MNAERSTATGDVFVELVEFAGDGVVVLEHVLKFIDDDWDSRDLFVCFLAVVFKFAYADVFEELSACFDFFLDGLQDA